jgi:hypothetical protein
MSETTFIVLSVPDQDSLHRILKNANAVLSYDMVAGFWEPDHNWNLTAFSAFVDEYYDEEMAVFADLPLWKPTVLGAIRSKWFYFWNRVKVNFETE